MGIQILLETESRELEDLIIKEYPGLLFPEQCLKTIKNNKKIYSFKLDLSEFQKLYRKFPEIEKIKYTIKPVFSENLKEFSKN